MTLDVVHYSGDRLGGAARAAYRIHTALTCEPSLCSRMVAAHPATDDPTVKAGEPGLARRLSRIVSPPLDALPLRLAAPADSLPRSAGWSSCIRAADINADATDIVHLHWICGGFLSIEEIGKIRKPLVWTLHDMWAFCGAEHLAEDTPQSRWRTGYAMEQQDSGRFDIDRWAWRRKRARWKMPMHVVAPSRWLARCARESELMRHWPVTVIPNPLDLANFKPTDRRAARRLLNLPEEGRLVLFGAIKGTQLPYKGWDLLGPALAAVAEAEPEVRAVIFGQSRPATSPPLGIQIHWMGHLFDDFSLAALYSAADVLVIPSRQESFGQTGSEAQACGCPVVAFDATGLQDVVAHGETGLLARPYDSGELASCLLALLRNDSLRQQLASNARVRAERLWSYPRIAAQYFEVYKHAAGR